MTNQIKGGLIWMPNTPIWLDFGALSPKPMRRSSRRFYLVLSTYCAAMSTVDSQIDCYSRDLDDYPGTRPATLYRHGAYVSNIGNPLLTHKRGAVQPITTA